MAGWNAAALRALGAADAPAAAPALAMLHTCMYNAWAAYDGAARQTTHGVAVRLPRAERDAASRASAMSHAAWLVLAGLFPAQRPLFDARMAGLGLDPAATGGPLGPAAIGRAQAAAVLDAGGTLPFAPAVMALERPPAAEPPARAAPALPLHCCRLARRLSGRGGYGDDQDVLLYFVLSNAVADTALAAGTGTDGPVPDACAAAAGLVLRRFGGSAAGALLPDRQRQAGAAGRALGMKVGTLVFDRARRYWQGKL